MIMSRHRLAILLLVVCGLPAGYARGEAGAPWSGEPTLISGTSRYDGGEWVYTDFVYDDYGADTVPAGQPNVVSLASTAGDFRYPYGTSTAGNAADVVEVASRADRPTESLTSTARSRRSNGFSSTHSTAYGGPSVTVAYTATVFVPVRNAGG